MGVLGDGTACVWCIMTSNIELIGDCLEFQVCNALALLQCVASHAETRSMFLAAHIPLLLYPFLNTTSKTRPFEYLRLTSLGVIGALVKVTGPRLPTPLLFLT